MVQILQENLSSAGSLQSVESAWTGCVPLSEPSDPTEWNLGGGAEPVTIGFYLVPHFPLLSFSAALDPLRQANRLSGRTLYRWVLISADGAAVKSSAAFDMPIDCSIDTAPRCDMVIICAGIDVTRNYNPRLLAWLRRLQRQSCRLGAISTGGYLLARAGLLDGRRCAIHWENAAEFQAFFPRCITTHEIFSVDGPFITSSGGTVTLDMMLYIVAASHGRALAAGISDQFNHSQIRPNDEAQRMRPEAKFGITNSKLCELIRAMEDSVDAPVDLSVLARRVNLSTRQIERLFRTHLNKTPSDFYLALRMVRARALVTQSSMALADIAQRCGYDSVSYFARTYRQQFGSSPSEARRMRAVHSAQPDGWARPHSMLAPTVPAGPPGHPIA